MKKILVIAVCLLPVSWFFATELDTMPKHAYGIHLRLRNQQRTG